MKDRLLQTGTIRLNVGAAAEEINPDWVSISLWGTPEHIEPSEIVEVNEDYTLRKLPDYDGMFIHHDVTKGLPFEDNSVEYIFSSHFIEHLHYPQALEYLKESYRVLKPGGIIRTICPDFMLWMEECLPGEMSPFFDAYKEAIDLDIHQNKVADYRHKFSHPLHFLNAMIYNWDHKWMWCTETLEIELLKLGFGNLKVLDYLVSDIPDIEVIENSLPENKIRNRNIESMFMEATKL